jgi:hypothetical protein
MTEDTRTLPELAAEINRVQKLIIDEQRTAVDRAIDIGTMLNRAKELNGKHGKWLDWLSQSCPDIPETTARLYMRMASNGQKLEEAAEEKGQRVADLSVRGAAKILAKERTTPTTPRRRNPKPEVAVAPVTPATSPDLKDLLAAVDVDELITALNAEWEWTQICYLHQLLSEKIDEHNRRNDRLGHVDYQPSAAVRQ